MMSSFTCMLLLCGYITSVLEGEIRSVRERRRENYEMIELL